MPTIASAKRSSLGAIQMVDEVAASTTHANHAKRVNFDANKFVSDSVVVPQAASLRWQKHASFIQPLASG